MKPLALSAAALFLAATAAFAVDTEEEDTPPAPAETARECAGAQVWDEMTKNCVDATESRLDDDARYRAARELPYAGQYDRALLVIDAADAPQDARFLTYRGFIARKTGDMEAALGWYSRALEIDPDNLLARSYMGQGLVETGDIDGARALLLEIRTLAGRDNWPYVALRQALAGQGSGY